MDKEKTKTLIKKLIIILVGVGSLLGLGDGKTIDLGHIKIIIGEQVEASKQIFHLLDSLKRYAYSVPLFYYKESK